MRNAIRVLLASVVVLLPALGAHAASAQVYGEHISSYRVVITIERNGTLEIRESIAYDFSVVPRHGIFRDLVQREHFDSKHDRKYDGGPPSARSRCSWGSASRSSSR